MTASTERPKMKKMTNLCKSCGQVARHTFPNVALAIPATAGLAEQFRTCCRTAAPRAETRPEVGQYGRFGQFLGTELGRIWPNVAECRPNLAENGPCLVDFG